MIIGNRATAIATAFAAALTFGCDAPDGQGPVVDVRNASGESVFVVTPPGSSGGTFRAIDESRLQPVLLLDGRSIDIVRRDAGWTAAFRLPDDASVDLVVQWRYTLDSGAVIDIAASPVKTVSEGSRARAIFVSEYRTLDFDIDGDGIDNLAEIRAGSDPMVASTTARSFVFDVDRPALTIGAVEPEALIIEVLLDGDSLGFVRNGLAWEGGFAIDDDVSHAFQVFWYTRVGDVRLRVLNSARITITRDSSLEELIIQAYGESPHDRDGDGRPNLAELREGSDPLVADERRPWRHDASSRGSNRSRSVVSRSGG